MAPSTSTLQIKRRNLLNLPEEVRQVFDDGIRILRVFVVQGPAPLLMSNNSSCAMKTVTDHDLATVTLKELGDEVQMDGIGCGRGESHERRRSDERCWWNAVRK